MHRNRLSINNGISVRTACAAAKKYSCHLRGARLVDDALAEAMVASATHGSGQPRRKGCSSHYLKAIHSCELQTRRIPTSLPLVAFPQSFSEKVSEEQQLVKQANIESAALRSRGD